MTDLLAEISAVFSEFIHDVVQRLPAVATGVALAIVGVLTAWAFERILIALARGGPIRRTLERVRFPEWLTRVGVQRPPDRFIGRVGFWVLLLLFLRTAAHALGLAPVSDAIGTLLGYLPDLVAAVLIFLVGTVLARVSGTLVRQAAAPAGGDVARTLSGLVQGIVLYAVGVMALSQLGIDTEIVRVFSIILLASLGLAFALAVGLGARTTLANVLAGYYARRSFDVGEEVTLEEGSGTVQRVTPSQIFLELEDRVLVMENTQFLTRVKSRPKAPTG